MHGSGRLRTRQAPLALAGDDGADKRIAEDVQKDVNSRFYEPGPYVPVEPNAIQRPGAASPILSSALKRDFGCGPDVS